MYEKAIAHLMDYVAITKPSDRHRINRFENFMALSGLEFMDHEVGKTILNLRLEGLH